MPSYELSMILRKLSRPALVSTLKRTGEMILDQGGILRQFINLGTKPLPYKMSAHNLVHREGTYFVMKFDSSPNSIEELSDALLRDVDIIRPVIIRLDPPKKFECTLEEELQPPAYRKDVKKLIEEGRKIQEPMFKARTPGFDYYPFQK
nr:EOG090X0IQO [Cyclestheria hislopi]